MASFFWWLILFSRLKVTPTDYWLLQSSNHRLCCHYYRHYYCETIIAYLNVCLVWITLQPDESIKSLTDEIWSLCRHLGEAKVPYAIKLKPKVFCCLFYHELDTFSLAHSAEKRPKKPWSYAQHSNATPENTTGLLSYQTMLNTQKCQDYKKHQEH